MTLGTTLAQTKTKLEQFQQNPDDPTPIQDLSKEDLSGDLLYSGILGYFASVDGSDQLAARSGHQVVAYRLPSYGTFKATAQPSYWFGVVRSVSFPGVTMDVDRIFIHAEAKDADPQKRNAFVRQIGSAASAFEHAAPELLFADPTKPLTDPSQPQGISAVKALAIPATQGQKIYTLNASIRAYHQSIVASLGTDADTKTEIANALAAGMEVTVHQAEINAYGWTGMGYTILDPDSGAGAYKISGGANGVQLINELFNTVLSFFFNLADFAKAALAKDIIDFIKNAYDLITTCDGAGLALAIYALVALTVITYVLAALVSGLAVYAIGLVMGWFVSAVVADIAAICKKAAYRLTTEKFV